jgi:hypothetical protein
MPSEIDATSSSALRDESAIVGETAYLRGAGHDDEVARHLARRRRHRRCRSERRRVHRREAAGPVAAGVVLIVARPLAAARDREARDGVRRDRSLDQQAAVLKIGFALRLAQRPRRPARPCSGVVPRRPRSPVPPWTKSWLLAMRLLSHASTIDHALARRTARVSRAAILCSAPIDGACYGWPVRWSALTSPARYAARTDDRAPVAPFSSLPPPELRPARWRPTKKSAASENAALETARKVALRGFRDDCSFPRRQPILADATKVSFAGARRATMT